MFPVTYLQLNAQVVPEVPLRHDLKIVEVGIDSLVAAAGLVECEGSAVDRRVHGGGGGLHEHVLKVQTTTASTRYSYY